MINPTGKKLEKIIFKLFDDASQGVDRYNHNGSLWAIFTNEMKWVVEFTKDQTLWYNYCFFKDEMELIGLDCVKNKDLIQKWFESRFLGIPKVEDFCEPFFDQDQYVEDTIQNGVKLTELSKRDFFPKDILQNGVKETKRTRLINLAATQMVEDTIQNGVKVTKRQLIPRNLKAKNVIENGVKRTICNELPNLFQVEDTIQNGVKHTDCYDGRRSTKVEYTIQNGVKHTKSMCGKRNGRVDNIVQNGVKHTEDGDWLDGDERIDDIIQEGVKETYDDCSDNIARVEGIIRVGKKII